MGKRILKLLMVVSSILVILSLFIFSDLNADIYSSISGRVIAEDTGEGVADVRVNIYFEGTQRGVKTDKNGFYIFEDLRPGSYSIIPRVSEGNYYVEKRVEVEVPKGKNVVYVNIVLKVGGKISGQVFYNDSVTPVDHAGIDIIDQNSQTAIGGGYTDENGSFFIQGIPPTDNADVKVSVFGYYFIKKQNITITKGQTTENINFILPSTETGVSGTVTDAETNLPIEDVLVVLVDSSGYPIIGETYTDTSGKYSIVGIPPGTYGIWAHTVDYEVSDKTFIIIEDKKISVFDISLQKKTLNNQGTTSIIQKAAEFVMSFITVSEAEATITPTFKRVPGISIDQSCEAHVGEVRTAINKVLKTAPSCLPTGIGKTLEELITTKRITIYCVQTVDCEKGKCSMPCGVDTYCANYGSCYPDSINICPIQFGEGPYAGKKECPCLQSMVLHELLHRVKFDEDITYPCALKYFSCARKAIRGERVETECCSDAVKFCCTQTRINCRECPPDMSKNFDPGPHPCDYEVCPQRC